MSFGMVSTLICKLYWKRKTKDDTEEIDVLEYSIYIKNIKIVNLAVTYSLWLPFFILSGIFRCRSPPLRV